jgi:hypothetical protein
LRWLCAMAGGLCRSTLSRTDANSGEWVDSSAAIRQTKCIQYAIGIRRSHA